MQPRAREGLSFVPSDNRPWNGKPHVHIAAIDNSLSFPIHHPNSWRSYCYGWLFLPSSLIGLPFSKQTREHFLPLLSSPAWWAQTVFELRQLFSKDDDFSEKMFRRQISLLKGQAWNISMSLRDPDAGPLELCRRSPCLVHDDEVVVGDIGVMKDVLDAVTEEEGLANKPQSAVDNGLYRPSVDRNQSSGGDRPSTPTKPVKPHVQRHSSERPAFRDSASVGGNQMSPRPLPVIQHVDLNRASFGNASGVSMMEHMERLQKQEEESARSHPKLHTSEGSLRETAPLINGHTGLQGSRIYRQGTSLDLERGAGRREERLRSHSIDNPAWTASLMNGNTSTKVVIVEASAHLYCSPKSR